MASQPTRSALMLTTITATVGIGWYISIILLLFVNDFRSVHAIDSFSIITDNGANIKSVGARKFGDVYRQDTDHTLN